MTARVVLSCDGLIPGGNYPCRQATPVGSPRDGAAARDTAHGFHGWRVALDSEGRLLDLCPPCARRAEEHPGSVGLHLLAPGRPVHAAMMRATLDGLDPARDTNRALHLDAVSRPS